MSDVEHIPPPRLLDDRSMGARIMPPKKHWQDELRERLDAEKAVDLINDCIAGRVDPTPLQIKSAEIALRKKLPDLAAVQLGPGGRLTLSNDADAPEAIREIRQLIVDPQHDET